ncbi:ribose-phosphate pyrophosphokinase [Candidatus Shapirobacteria bacterium CG10_big_fil_rev_8_21_14_0_10_38_14]|uniref:Ribose-phosphate pyrophosphokinase n=1 Tax=Candidatus Shapirobacteria bacterium CG10_big_fil_rev_8_21_14_0_10_38_14 TaxID=1974483 RepID=A0A2M8L5E2_9BACT|nr:MAG: ribose-phosphate pyrophosphokinase [Candidatus Shapirobacteria bacterium CG10_big_fil_rev_8_21_14_0_10_38_14]
MGRIHLIAGSSHPQLARKIARLLKIPLTPIKIKKFANGEIYVRIKKKVRSEDVFLVQTMSAPINEHLVELLITIDALKRASASRINIVCPHLCYSRQDRKVTSREPISAKLIANLITTAGADRLITVDLHAEQIQGFYDIPFDHFVGYPQFAQYLLGKKIKNMVIVSPDIGGVKRGAKMASLLHAPLVIVDKRRKKHNQAEVSHVIGEVKGKTAVILDDIIDTAGTVAEVSEILKQGGATEVIVCVTHALLSGDACQKLARCPASQILLLDTLPLPKEKKLAKIKVISLAPLLAKVIKRIHQGCSLGALFTWEKKEVIL